MIRENWIEIEYKKVVNKVSTSKHKIKQKDYLTKGLYPVIDQGQEIVGGYTDDKSKLLECDLPVLVFGDHTKIVKLINFNFAPGADGTKVLEPKSIVIPKFLFYVTQTLVMKIKDKGYARHYQHIEKHKFFLFPLPEQRAIVDKIDQLFSKLDNSISNLKNAKEKLEIYRQAVLKKAFEGELTNTNNIKWITLGEVCSDVEYGTSSKSDNEGLIPVLRMGNIQNGKIDWEDLKYTSNKEEIEKYRLYKEDVLFNRTNSPEHVGKTAIFKGEREAIFAGYLIRINYDKDVVNGDYLNYFLNCHIAKIYGNKVKSFGVNQSNINGTKLKGYPFPKTTLDEQTKIVYEIETRLSVCDKIIANIEQDLERAEALRQSILNKAFEGKLLSEEEIEDCRREPDWEPADKLLERIKRNEEVKV
ncbi:restriction endonuclease subunit S [Bacillus sp. FJAT-27245]|uniref:restriction endonuclease subunit S n=1 Tax=Bacillus sp. FJAT-27245 TaxID=1684144 RepID=UPI0006A7EBE4|nr:restriction endonuclease subunit S [Bacillus sp. FJAT-27245]